MSWQNGDPTTKIRSIASALPAVAAASGLGGSNFVATADDAKDRRLTGIFSTFQTKFARVHLRIAGKLIMQVDFSLFAASHGFLECDQVYGATLQLEYALESINPGGPAIVANTDELVFRYETVPG